MPASPPPQASTMLIMHGFQVLTTWSADRSSLYPRIVVAGTASLDSILGGGLGRDCGEAVQRAQHGLYDTERVGMSLSFFFHS